MTIQAPKKDAEEKLLSAELAFNIKDLLYKFVPGKQYFQYMRLRYIVAEKPKKA